MQRHICSIMALVLLLAASCTARATDSSDNAALRYWRAWSLITPDVEAEASRLTNSWLDDPDWAETMDPYLRQALAERGLLMTTILRATALEHCDFANDYQDGLQAIFPQFRWMRATARLLVIDARLALDEGDVNRSVNRLAAAYALAQHATQDKVIIGGLVSIAIFALVDREVAELAERGLLTNDHRRELLAMLVRFERSDPFGFHMSLEREAEITLRWLRDRVGDGDQLAELTEMVIDRDPRDEPQSWRQLLRVVESGEGFDQPHAEFARYYKDVLATWNEADGAERIWQVYEEARDGEYGLFAYWYAPDFSRVQKQDHRVGRLTMRDAKQRLRATETNPAHGDDATSP